MNDPFAPGMNREHLKALWDAYFEESGMPVLHPSFERVQALRALDRIGVTPEDVRAVVKWVRKLMNKPRSNFSPTALDWRNLIARTDTFEEHLTNARKGRRGKGKAEHPTSKSDAGRAIQHPTSNDGAVAPVVDEERLREQRRVEIEKLKREIGR